MKLRSLSITEINQYISQSIKSDSILQSILIYGEISNLKKHSNGNYYFTLKDSNCKISCINFSDRKNIDGELYEGDSVQCLGKLSYFERDGNISFIVNEIEKIGLGKSYSDFLKLKKRLSESGLFDQKNKKPLPYFPKKIGVITSPTGAVIQDIFNVINNRCPKIKIVLYPTLVQGDGAANEIINGINHFNSQDDEKAEVIIIARGGGSYEDLQAFNSEALANSIFDSNIPIVSAIGHETDFTIADFVSDKRASTPSMAAEISVPEISVIYSRLSQLKRSLDLFSPDKQINLQKNILEKLRNDIDRNIKNNLIIQTNRIDSLREQLIILNPLNLLHRGYSIVLNESGEKIVDSKKVEIGQELSIILSKGKMIVEVMEVDNEV